MTEGKPDTAHEWVGPDDAPELTEEMLDYAELSVGGKVIRPATGVLTKDGMRPISEKRQPVTLRLTPEVIDHFKAGGEGWQSRIGDILERHVDEAKRKPA
jgi:uncharacterized protein (DUF4415 family)